MNQQTRNPPPIKNRWKTGTVLLAGLFLAAPLVTSCSKAAVASAVALQPVMETLLAPTLNAVVVPALNTALVPELDSRALAELKKHNVTPDNAPFLWSFLDGFVPEETKVTTDSNAKVTATTSKTQTTGNTAAKNDNTKSSTAKSGSTK